jgi:UDP-glucose 4-epimerase
MNILVTGGAGFIGSHVAEAFLASGHEVVVLDNLSSGRRENVPRRARFVEMDLLDSGLTEFLASHQFQVISHHAAQISVPASVNDPVHDAQVNIVALVRLLEASRHHGLECFIFASSGGAVYGEMNDRPADEDHRPRPMSPYAIAKRAGEMYLDFYNSSYGLRTVCLRYANVYGPRQIPQAEAGVIAIFMDSLIEDRRPTIYRHPDMPRGMLRDYVFVRDCARANVLALEHGSGVYNIGTGLALDTLSLWEALQKVAGKNIGPDFAPPRPGDLRASWLNCARAGKELAWRAEVTLEAGLAETWSWRTGNGCSTME